MYARGPGGVARIPAQTAFAHPTEPLIGNNNPAWTGSPGNTPDVPGPHPRTQPMAGNVGNFDGFSGSDPHMPKIQPRRFIHLSPMQETAYRPGITGFNDQLQVRDRHAYWRKGYSNTGTEKNNPAGMPNTYNDPRERPPRPELATINVSVNPQIGSDASRNQDDLSRPYTWLGQWDGSLQPVYGGVPGLWANYGNRGLASQIHDPSNGEGGPAVVYSGPPHGLHSDTIPSGKQILDRYKSTPQMRPVRFDRPSNSTSAGQSYSQTVQPQGATGPRAAATSSGLGFRVTGRGWAGQ